MLERIQFSIQESLPLLIIQCFVEGGGVGAEGTQGGNPWKLIAVLAQIK